MLETYVGPVEQYLPSTVELPPRPLTPPQPTLEELQQTHDLSVPAPVIEPAPEPVLPKVKTTDSPPQTKAAIKKGLPKQRQRHNQTQKITSTSLPVLQTPKESKIRERLPKKKGGTRKK